MKFHHFFLFPFDSDCGLHSFELKQMKWKENENKKKKQKRRIRFDKKGFLLSESAVVLFRTFSRSTFSCFSRSISSGVTTECKRTKSMSNRVIGKKMNRKNQAKRRSAKKGEIKEKKQEEQVASSKKQEASRRMRKGEKKRFSFPSRSIRHHDVINSPSQTEISSLRRKAIFSSVADDVITTHHVSSLTMSRWLEAVLRNRIARWVPFLIHHRSASVGLDTSSLV